jgi:hypothetical protein
MRFDRATYVGFVLADTSVFVICSHHVTRKIRTILVLDCLPSWDSRCLCILMVDRAACVLGSFNHTWPGLSYLPAVETKAVASTPISR